MFEIIKTNPGDSDFHLFEQILWDLYPRVDNNLTISDSLNLEFLEACFVMCKNGKVLSRAALYVNPGLYYHNKKTACVGNYQSFDDIDGSRHLFQAINEISKSLSADYLIGPMNGSTWDNYRFCLPSENPHFFLEPYHLPYYIRHFQSLGFKSIARYYSDIENGFNFNTSKILNRQNEFEKVGVKFRFLNLNEFENELKNIYQLNILAFDSNFLFTSISLESFINKYSALLKFINPKYITLAEDEDTNLIGYCFCIPDFCSKEGKTLVAKTIARHPAQKWHGIGHVLSNMAGSNAEKDGYDSFIHALIYDQGSSKTLTNSFAGNLYKEYELYGMDL